MRIKTVCVIAMAGALGLSLSAAPGGQTPLALEQQLRNQYPVTAVGINGVVTRPGTVLVVQKDGIRALPGGGKFPCNAYKSGDRVKQGPLVCVLNYSVSRDRQVALQVGDKAYLTKIEAKGDEIIFSLQSCGVCNPAQPDPNGMPYSASVAFQFAKNSLGTASLKEVADTIGQVLLIDNSVPPPPVPTDPQVKPAEETPTEPPPGSTAPPATVGLGQTVDQIVAALGQPDRVAKVGNKEIYFYKDMKVTFIDGKVSDVE